jgi:hypothetical protein
MRKVAPPTRSSVVMRTFFRPIRSPKWPKNRPPSGRAMNPTPNVANATSVPTAGSRSGKNSTLNTTAAAVP